MAECTDEEHTALTAGARRRPIGRSPSLWAPIEYAAIIPIEQRQRNKVWERPSID